MTIRSMLIMALAAIALLFSSSGEVRAKVFHFSICGKPHEVITGPDGRVISVEEEGGAIFIKAATPKKSEGEIRYMVICDRPHKVTVGKSGHVVDAREVPQAEMDAALKAKKAAATVKVAEKAAPLAPEKRAEKVAVAFKADAASSAPSEPKEAGWYPCTGFSKADQSPYLDNPANQDPDNTRANKASTFEAVDRVLSLRRPTKPVVTVICGRISKSALKFKKGGGFNIGAAAYNRLTKEIFQGTGIVGQPDGDPDTDPITYVFEGQVPKTAAAVASGHCEKYWSKELFYYNIRTGAPWKSCWGVASADPDHVENIAYKSAAGNLVRDLEVKYLTQRQCDEQMRAGKFTPVSSQGTLYYVNPGASVEDFADARCTSPDKYLWQRACWRNGFPMISFPITGPVGPLASNAMAWIDAAVYTRNNFPARDDATYAEIRTAENEARAGGYNTGYLTASIRTTRGSYLFGATRTHLDSMFFYGREKGRMENYLGVSESWIKMNDGKTRVRSTCDFANIAFRPFAVTEDNWGMWLGGSGIYSGWRSHATPWNTNDHGKNLGGGGSIKAVRLGDNGFGGEIVAEGGYLSKTQTCKPKNVDGGYNHLYGQIWFPGLRVNDNVAFFDAVDADFFIAPRELNLAARIRALHIMAYRRDVVNLRPGLGYKWFPGIKGPFSPVASLGLLDDSVIPFGSLTEIGVSVSLTKLARFANRANIFSNTYEVDWETHQRVYRPKVEGGKNLGSRLNQAAWDAL